MGGKLADSANIMSRQQSINLNPVDVLEIAVTAQSGPEVLPFAGPIPAIAIASCASHHGTRPGKIAGGRGRWEHPPISVPL
jgi:hypothetical protein